MNLRAVEMLAAAVQKDYFAVGKRFVREFAARLTVSIARDRRRV